MKMTERDKKLSLSLRKREEILSLTKKTNYCFQLSTQFGPKNIPDQLPSIPNIYRRSKRANIPTIIYKFTNLCLRPFILSSY